MRETGHTSEYKWLWAFYLLVYVFIPEINFPVEFWNYFLGVLEEVIRLGRVANLQESQVPTNSPGQASTLHSRLYQENVGLQS